MKSRFILYLLGGALALSGCTVLEGDKIDYKSAGKAPTLDVPPDLTQLAKDSRFAVAGNAVTASSFKPAAGVPAGSTALATLGDVRIERIGNQRWLVVNRPPEALWQPVNDFWKESGFLMSSSQASLGIMETDWAENRAKIPQDFIRSTLGKVLDGLYSSGERDRFRTRLESSGSGSTEIFISHRAMLEVYGDAGKTSTVWQARPADPELEAEMLRRLMVRLGASQEQSKAVQAATPAAKTSRVATISGQTVVQIDEGFERAWRRVGLSLDRTNFTVEDRDRSKGLYFVRYVEPVVDKSEPGFFSKLFSAGKVDVQPLKFRISLSSTANLTTVAVQNASGAADQTANAQRILKVISEDLQ